jgi:hypothetical protein
MKNWRQATVFTTASPEAVAHFARTGWLLTRTLDDAQTAALRRWVDDVAAWPDDGDWLHYRELTDAGAALCRTENFVPFHEGLRTLLTAGPMLEIASALLGEEAVLYKEKINYKLSGGAGYSPHQDAPAYRFVEVHVSCMVAVDDAGEDNGCLEVASASHASVLPVDERGCIADEVVAQLEWMPVPVQAGETLWFHSRTPHRSGPNQSPHPRRALYPTYNALREGDLRTRYYDRKRAEFAAASPGDRVQVSLIGDFEGRPVT